MESVIASSFPPAVYTVLFVICCLWLWHIKQTNSRIYKMGMKLPGLDPLPLIGSAHLALGKNAEELAELGLKLAAEFGEVARAFMGPLLYIYLIGPDDIEIILESNEHIVKSPEYRFFEPWLGDGLLITAGEKWRYHRKIIAPTFHHNVLKTFIQVFNEKSLTVIKQMEVEKGKEFDIHKYMGDVTVDILVETAMGIRNENAKGKSVAGYADAVIDLCNIVHMRHLKFYLRSDTIFNLTSYSKEQNKLINIIHGLTNRVIKNKKAELSDKAQKNLPNELAFTKSYGKTTNTTAKPLISDTVFQGYRDDLDFIDENDVGEKKRSAFLDLLLESSQNGTNNLTDKEIADEVNTIMFEGHDTTAAGSSFALCLLAINHNIQDKAYAELYNIFGDSDRPVTYEDTVEMKLLERIILESLRLYPPVPGIARQLKTDVKIKTGGYVLPAGATVGVAMYSAHRNPKYYKEPAVFNPDNFLPENVLKRPYYSFVPFSAGPRSCVGRKYALLKLKVLLANILRNYRVVSDVTEDQWKLRADIILKRADGFRLRIEPRKRVIASF